jgi:hypothetical protein
MNDEIRRSVLKAEIVVETRGSTEAHEATVLWASQRLKSAHMRVRDGGVYIRVQDGDGHELGFAGHGVLSSRDSKEILDDFFDVSATPEAS